MFEITSEEVAGRIDEQDGLIDQKLALTAQGGAEQLAALVGDIGDAALMDLIEGEGAEGFLDGLLDERKVTFVSKGIAQLCSDGEDQHPFAQDDRSTAALPTIQLDLIFCDGIEAKIAFDVATAPQDDTALLLRKDATTKTHWGSIEHRLDDRISRIILDQQTAIRGVVFSCGVLLA